MKKKPIVYDNRNGREVVPESISKDRLHAKWGDSLKLVGPYRGVHGRTDFRCMGCGNVFSSNFYERLKAGYPCKKCMGKEQGKGRRLTHTEFMDKMKERLTLLNIKVLGKYVKSQVGILVRCRRCSHEWSPRPNNLLHSDAGCPQCASYGSFRSDFQTVQLGTRKVRVQGYEPQALDWMLGKGVNPKEIHVFTEGRIPKISYVFKRKKRTYHPDILYGKNIVEVKSIWTLLNWLDVNKEKAKAVIQSGYDYRMIVVGSQTVCLPTEWLKWNAKRIKDYLRKKMFKPVNILALDPGSKNFGWSVVELSDNGGLKIVANGMIKNTLIELKEDVWSQGRPFIRELRGIMRVHNVGALISERFMPRGYGGNTIESVNQMIGMALGSMWNKKRNAECILIPAAQWKNAVNRVSDLDDLYTKCIGCTPHQVDACMIGLYGGYTIASRVAYSDFKALEKSLIAQIIDTNQEP
jgi:hypothetical protein